MGTEVRTIRPEEAGEFVRQRGRGFLRVEPESAAAELVASADLDRTRGAFDGADVVGTLRSFQTEFTVPGGRALRTSALTNVTVAPTHRRRGILTEMITGDLRDSAARGEAVSILIASESPIYGRFGYGHAVDGARYSVATEHLRFLRPSVGSIELVDLDALRVTAPAVFDRFRISQPGSISRTPWWWDRSTRRTDSSDAEPHKGFQALYRSPSGEVDGFVRYEGNQEWEEMRPKGTLVVDELVATTPDAYQALWEYCCSVDLLTTATAANRPVDEVLPLLVHNARHVRLTARHDFVWVRVLDPVAALEGRGYARDGRVVVRVHDTMGFAHGTFALEAGVGWAHCERTQDPAHLEAPVTALGSVLVGGVSWTRLAAAGLVTELAAGSLALADSMFLTPRAPWCTTWF